jgi:ATP-binding cassette, subfamily C (CFTR/MRP), member 1
MGWASHLTQRLMTMMRGGLVSLIYEKMMQMRIVDINESAAMALMGTDVQRIAELFYWLAIEAGPAVIQLGVAMYLLYLQLGLVFVIPVGVSLSESPRPSHVSIPADGFLVATALSFLVANHSANRQRSWLEAIQSRINFTSEIFGSMKSVKMLGLSERMRQHIQQMRDDEMSISKRYRTVKIYQLAIGKRSWFRYRPSTDTLCAY